MRRVVAIGPEMNVDRIAMLVDIARNTLWMVQFASPTWTDAIWMLAQAMQEDNNQYLLLHDDTFLGHLMNN